MHEISFTSAAIEVTSDIYQWREGYGCHDVRIVNNTINQCNWANSVRVPQNRSHAPEEARCGVGPRLPLLVISPYAKHNFADGTFTTQTWQVSARSNVNGFIKPPSGECYSYCTRTLIVYSTVL